MGKEPMLVHGLLGKKGSGCYYIDCGWSHNVAMVKQEQNHNNIIQLYGWGRNDKGQLGEKLTNNTLLVPSLLLHNNNIKNIINISCGSEYTMIITKNGTLYTCGWNEHGNLGIRSNNDINHEFKEMIGFNENIQRYYYNENEMLEINSCYKDFKNEIGRYILFAAGGAHFLSILS